jgi:hypothetical protein
MPLQKNYSGTPKLVQCNVHLLGTRVIKINKMISSSELKIEVSDESHVGFWMIAILVWCKKKTKV